MRKLIVLLLGTACLGLLWVQAALAVDPVPEETEVIDVPNDDGTHLGVLWKWLGATDPGDKVTILLEVSPELLETFRLTPEEQTKLDNAKAMLAQDLAPLLTERDAAQAELDKISESYNKAKVDNAKDLPQQTAAYFTAQAALDEIAQKIEQAKERLSARIGCRTSIRAIHDLDTKARYFEYLSASLGKSTWLPTNIDGNSPEELSTKGDHPEIFGQEPEEPDKVYAQIDSFKATNPQLLADPAYQPAADQYDYIAPATLDISLQKGHMYNLRMVIDRQGSITEKDLGGAKTQVNYFSVSLLNNFIFAVGFSIIILVAIMLARRNPNMFIRRIQGLEAVDEAIGRATEMGKPVLYLCGLDPLSTLSTLAAINILGRVARRIADYDSDLLVPCRDPVVLTVAQEVVREGYIDQGRPDAYREDKIWFVTDDQFAYTAATCGIMMREKPAANFFMGYYYAESLLLTETGASTGAIQIAGTDSLAQLPFFITTCDYTLIGEELYAASAYLSREPLLLGSLKGQDVGKALIMILILVQTLLFIVSYIGTKMSPGFPALDYLRKLVQPL